MRKYIENKFFLSKILFVLVTMLASLSGCNSSEDWTIRGSIPEDLSNIKMVYLYTVGEYFKEDRLLDSAVVEKGKFIFRKQNVSDDFLEYAILLTPSSGQNYHIMLEKGDDVSIDIHSKEVLTKYSGSKILDEYMAYIEISKRETLYTQKKSKVYQTLNFSNQDSIKHFMIDYQRTVKKFMDERIDKIRKIQNPNLSSFLAARDITRFSQPTKTFIQEFWDALSEESKRTRRGKQLKSIYEYYEAYSILRSDQITGYKSLKRKYNLLTQSNKISSFGKKILDKLKELEKTQVGSPPPPMISRTIDNKPFNLNNTKAKVILIDFWASWCIPCRKENLNYIRLYKKYKKKGLKIIGYSVDTDAKKWKEAVLHDKLSWIQVSNLNKNDEINKSYNVKIIPSNFIIIDNKIVAIDLFGVDLDDFLKKVFQ